MDQAFGSKRGKKYLLLLALLCVLMAACSPTATPIPPTETPARLPPTDTPVPPTATPTHTPTPVPPTATPTHTSTPVPPTATATHTPTPVPPTATPTHTPTETVSPALDCDIDQVLPKLRSVVALSEFDLVYNSIDGFASFALWFVDPDLDLDVSGDEIEENSTLAIRHAATLSHQLHNADPCVQELADAINPVVVDRKYNGWFAGLIAPSSLPGDTSLTDEQLAEIAGDFEITYLREVPVPPIEPASADSCSWVEARRGIQQHWEFSGPPPENCGAWLTIDESGTTVMAQWPGRTGKDDEYAVPLMMAGALNVAMELGCLHPQLDLLVLLVVDDDGHVGLVGVWPGEAVRALDMNQLQIEYVGE